MIRTGGAGGSSAWSCAVSITLVRKGGTLDPVRAWPKFSLWQAEGRQE